MFGDRLPDAPLRIVFGQEVLDLWKTGWSVEDDWC